MFSLSSTAILAMALAVVQSGPPPVNPYLLGGGTPPLLGGPLPVGPQGPGISPLAVPQIGPQFIQQAQPYEFGYNHQHEDGATVNRQESSDGVRQRGSYGYTGPDGLYRQVNYIADELGFRADIQTNEPGTTNQNPAGVSITAREPPYKVLSGGGPGGRGTVVVPTGQAGVQVPPQGLGGFPGGFAGPVYAPQQGIPYNYKR